MIVVDVNTCSAYDCEYVALAEDLRAPPVTSDKQILTEFPALTASLKTFAETARPRDSGDA